MLGRRDEAKLGERSMLGHPDRPGRHAEHLASLPRRKPGHHSRQQQHPLLGRQPGQQRPGALRVDRGHGGLLGSWPVIGHIGQVTHRNRQPGGVASGVGYFMRGNAEHERAEWPTAITVTRQRGDDRDTYFLRDIIGDLAIAAKRPKPGVTITQHHRPYLR